MPNLDTLAPRASDNTCIFTHISMGYGSKHPTTPRLGILTVRYSHYFSLSGFHPTVQCFIIRIIAEAGVKLWLAVYCGLVIQPGLRVVCFTCFRIVIDNRCIVSRTARFPYIRHGSQTGILVLCTLLFSLFAICRRGR